MLVRVEHHKSQWWLWVGSKDSGRKVVLGVLQAVGCQQSSAYLHAVAHQRSRHNVDNPKIQPNSVDVRMANVLNVKLQAGAAGQQMRGCLNPTVQGEFILC